MSAPVRLEGAFFNWHSLALVNREIATGLLRGGKVELSIVPTEPAQFAPRSEPRIAPLAERSFATLTGPAAVHVRHFYPPRFERPDEGKFVLMQPWEYGFLPTRWVEPIRDNVDEVWCYSRYVRDVYVASGIPAAKLQVVPLGVDAATFTPEAPPYVFTTETGAAALRGRHGRFVFLFVGSTQHRKGIDILLEAYRRAFTVYDDVCLVIKDTGTQTVYRYGNKKEEILALIADSGHAPIVYLDDDLPPALLAGLYTAADCLVQCYRGEGFCLPALEGMSCGLPVMATAGGPTDDFVDDAVGWPLPSERRQFGNGSVGDMDCVGPAWMFEVDVDTLARTMRRVSQQPEQVAEKGRVAAERVRTAWTWAHTVAAIEARITALAAVAPTPRTVVPRAVNDRSVDGKPAEAGSGGFTLRSTPAVNFSPVSGGRPEGPRRGSGGGGARKTSRANGKAANDSPPPFLGQGEGASGAASPEPWTLDPKPCLRPQPTISLCMIVRNEERVFGACLDTATPHFDEVIVVDTGSTDRTVEIAKAHGAKVFHFPWTESFSEARNVSLSHATGDWLFWMDADDTLPEACGRALRDLVRLAEDRTTGFLMQVQIPAAPGENGFTVVDHVKLFRNRPELRFEGRIHEQILDPIYRAGGNIERTNLYVVHSGYDYSPEGQKHKRARDLRLLDLDLAERPDHPFVLFNIGMTAYHMKDYEKAISALERCLAVSKPHESTVRKVYAMLEGCHLEQGDLMRARERLEQGLALYPQDPELLFRAGILYRELGDPAAAERAYVKLLRERETGHIDSLDVSMLTYKAHHNLALIYQDLGRLQEAYREWQAALADNPSFVPSLLGCAELLLHLRRFEDAEAIAARLDHLAPDAATTLRGRLEAARELQHV